VLGIVFTAHRNEVLVFRAVHGTVDKS
jgi:hypothetical protein